jgi:hypothetical protein
MKTRLFDIFFILLPLFYREERPAMRDEERQQHKQGNNDNGKHLTQPLRSLSFFASFAFFAVNTTI